MTRTYVRRVMKRASLTSVLALLIGFLNAACSSTETLSNPSASQSSVAVPGEKTGDDERYAPGPMGSSNVRW